jgi:subtilisin family serine protease
MMIAVAHLDTGVDPDRVAPDRWAATDWQGTLVEDGAPNDREGHGTATAAEIRRHAPGAQLWAVAVMHGGDVIARIVAGLRWAIDERAQVVSMSLGLRAPNPVLDQLLVTAQAAGMLVVAAIGNTGAGTAREPARHPDVLAVGACDAHGLVLRMSGSVFDPRRGVHKPDVLAPGATGTSAAAAAVAGIAADLWSRFPDATGEDVRAAIQATATPVPVDLAHRTAAGAVDPEAARRWLDAGNRAEVPVGGQPARLIRPYRDPRLLRQLRHAPPGAELAAVLVGTETEVVRAPADRIAELIRATDPVVASAADVDLWWGGPAVAAARRDDAVPTLREVDR